MGAMHGRGSFTLAFMLAFPAALAANWPVLTLTMVALSGTQPAASVVSGWGRMPPCGTPVRRMRPTPGIRPPPGCGSAGRQEPGHTDAYVGSISRTSSTCRRAGSGLALPALPDRSCPLTMIKDRLPEVRAFGRLATMSSRNHLKSSVIVPPANIKPARARARTRPTPNCRHCTDSPRSKLRAFRAGRGGLWRIACAPGSALGYGAARDRTT